MKSSPYGLAAIGALGAGMILTWAWPQPIPTGSVEAGCALAIANGMAAAAVNRLSLRRLDGTFFKMVALGHGLRAAVLFVTVCGSVVLFGKKAAPFALTTLAGYFCFLAAEVLSLYVHGLSRTGNSLRTGTGETNQKT